MALEDSVFPSRPDSLSLPVDEKPEEGVEVATETTTAATGIYNLPSDELGHVVTTETLLPPAKVNKTFQAKLAEREANANQPCKKIQGTEKERGRFGWGEWELLMMMMMGCHLNAAEVVLYDAINMGQSRSQLGCSYSSVVLKNSISYINELQCEITLNLMKILVEALATLTQKKNLNAHFLYVCASH